MACAESKATARVESGWLYHDGDEGAIQIGDSRWYRWLQLGKTFYYAGQDGGTFTGRSEERHGQLYWYGFKRLEGGAEEKVPSLDLHRTRWVRVARGESTQLPDQAASVRHFGQPNTHLQHRDLRWSGCGTSNRFR